MWDVHKNRNVFLGLTVCDIRTNENIYPGLTMWDVHKNGNIFLRLSVCDIHTNGNVFLGFAVWDVLTTGNDFAYKILFFGTTVHITIFGCSPVAHELILPSVCARRAYPRRFLGRVRKTPLSPSLTRRRFQMPSRKGVKNRLFRTDAHQ